MFKLFITPLFVLCVLLLTQGLVHAADLPTDIKSLKIELDRINFDLKGDDRNNRLEALIPHTRKLSEQNPDNAAFAMMAGFYNIQYASATGGIGAIKYAKAARDLLQKSIELDPNAFGASAHAVLGRIFVSIPGWPIAFGDKKKGISHMQKALELAPGGMDSNVTYAGYLLEEKEYAEAKKYFLKAKKAPPREYREKADIELHKMIDETLLDIEKKLVN